MKTFTKILSSTVLLLILSVEVVAQVPQGFNFQAVATAPDGMPISSVEIGVQIEVIKGSEDGNVLYSEAHTVTTNPLGLFQIIIGEGIPADGNDFSAIDWGNDNYYVGFGVDLTGTGIFDSLGKTRLLSVPYALLAEDVINGSSVEPSTVINLDYSLGDTSFVINQIGANADDFTPALIVNSELSGTNQAIDANTFSQTGSEQTQYGISGSAIGEGTGTHIGVLASAVHPEGEGTGERRYGLYGQARSNGRENIGGFGIGLGDGDGEIVLRGDEFADGEFNIGGFNAGFIGFARQNLNGNIGVRGYVYGDAGARSNRALQAEARTTADGVNIGLQALVSGSLTENIGIEVDVFDETDSKNFGAVINTGGSTVSNIGLIVNADTAAMLNGQTIVNSDLTVNGNVVASSVTETSDERLKTNITNLSNTLDNALALRGVSYNWIDKNKTQSTQIGVIAQEVEEIYPEFVHTDYNGMKSVNYSQMVAVLIEAVKELNNKIEVLESENSQLQAQVDDIETMKVQINQLMTLITVETEHDSFSADK